MLTQPLLDKLTQLRLTAFRAALEEQLHNPQYTDLSFEDRLGLLVDVEFTHRDNTRLKRRLRTAKLSLPATIEDLDMSASRGLDRSLVLHLAQGEWITRMYPSASTSISSSSARPVSGRHSSLARWPTRPAVTTSPSATTAPPGSSTRSPSPTPTAPVPSSSTPSPAPIS
jgi:hypothetical protein